ncbi:histidine phosphatase family protein, partial [Streptomyces sp. NPDC093064]
MTGSAARYLYLARHRGASPDESELTDEGRRQAALLGERLRGGALPLDRGHPDHWIVKIHRTGVPVGDVEVLA